MKIQSYLFPISAVLFFILLITITIFNLYNSSKEYVSSLIAHDVTRLSEIFMQIDKQCKIINFEYQKNPINFLNVKKFVGSEIGPMNLTYPEKWDGPYLDDNPTIQEKEYLLVHTKQGYFITPGEGVKLPNGKTIGINIILHEDADINTMMQDEKALKFKDKVFAAPVPLSIPY